MRGHGVNKVIGKLSDSYRYLDLNQGVRLTALLTSPLFDPHVWGTACIPVYTLNESELLTAFTRLDRQNKVRYCPWKKHPQCLLKMIKAKLLKAWQCQWLYIQCVCSVYTVCVRAWCACVCDMWVWVYRQEGRERIWMREKVVVVVV